MCHLPSGVWLQKSGVWIDIVERETSASPVSCSGGVSAWGICAPCEGGAVPSLVH
jgi:hypothetical protein